MSDSHPTGPVEHYPGLYVQSVGSGPKVVLLHGWGMHSGVWEDVVEALADHYRVTMMDLPGYGYSRLAKAGHTLKDLSHAVAAVAPQRASWVGWSLGGLIAQRLAIDAPERIARLILVSSSPRFVRSADWPHAIEFKVLQQFADGLDNDYRATLKRFLALEVHGSEGAAEQLRLLRGMVFQHGEPDPRALADGLVILEHTDLRSEWDGIRCPTLLLMGERDNLVPAAAGAAIQALLPNARLHIFKQAGHAPFFSQLMAFIHQLRAFLDE